MATFDPQTKIWEGLKVPYSFAKDATVGSKILKNLAATPDRILNVCHDDGISTSCAETRTASIRVAQNLTRLGFKQGDVFGFICRNGIDLTPTLYGSILIGAPVNPLDIEFKKDDIMQMFKQTKPKLVFCDADVYETTKVALNELESDASIITLREKVHGVSYINKLLAPTGSEDSYIATNFGDASKVLVAILCSSGTTGSMKGVNLSHAHVLSYLKMFKQPQDIRSLSFSPIYWSIGLLSTILVALRPNETKIITSQPFSVELFVHIIKKHNVSFFQAAPYQLSLLVQSPLLDPRDFVGVQQFLVLGSVVSENLRKEFQDVFPRHPLIIAYGMSESCMAISSTDPRDNIDGLTVGRITPNIYVKVIDKEGNPLEIGRIGEIMAKPEFEFMGYYGNSEASKLAIDAEGFIATGDIGYIDEGGCIFIIDRKKEIMKYKGYQVNPSEIENIIESIEGVEFVSVVGIPDPIATNLPAAVIVKRPEFDELTEEFIVDYVAKKLPEYKQLHGGVHFVDELPMTPSGKVQKRFVKVFAIKEFNEKLALKNML